jgi:hypothetical protein
MRKAEILAELPKLKATERTQVFERLCELQERDGQRGEPWRDVLPRLQSSRSR